MTVPNPFDLQPKDSEGLVFREPWEAQAFALAVSLHQSGLFAWDEWAAALAEEIKSAQQAGDPDLGNTYYTHWLRALEKMVARKAAVKDECIAERAEEWRDAYLQTPHGKAVELVRK